MNTTERLKASIEHWEENLALAKQAAIEGRAPKIIITSSACSLCAAFSSIDIAREERCVGCPVHSKTGKPGCAGTPWEVVNRQYTRLLCISWSSSAGYRPIEATEDEVELLIEAIEDEVKFLRSLDNESCS